MQRMMGYMRKAIEEYRMLEDGDVLAVGVSGGKDSLVLLAGLAGLRKFIGIDFQMVAITIDMGFQDPAADFSPIEAFCRGLGVEYRQVRTEIGPVIFEARRESNPCSLCARMRRGALHDAALAAGCNKLALGHHYNDAVETFMMNLFQEGRIGCFSPVTYLSRKKLTMIRPLIFAPEREIAGAAKKAGLPVVKNPCPADGVTQREWTKNFLRELEREHRGVTRRIFGAMRRGHISGW